MIRVIISGWKTGLDTVRAIKAIREHTGRPLNEAMALVNKVLAQEEVHLDLAEEKAAVLVDALTNLGMVTGVAKKIA